jgi:transient receptor potential cation channel subfamily A member 1
MVKFGRINHLSHPLCETLLRQKWLSYGCPIYMLNLCFYLLFLLVFSYFIITFPSCNHHDTVTIGHDSPSTCPNHEFRSFKQATTLTQIFCVWYLVLYCFFNFVLELIQLAQDGWAYFNDIENYIQWILYLSTSIFTLPFLYNQSLHYQWVAGSVGIFLAYFALLFLLGRFDIYGIYVIMFLEIMKTLLHVLSLFSILILGFALTFCIIRPFPQVIFYEQHGRHLIESKIKISFAGTSTVGSATFIHDHHEIGDDDAR